MSIRLFAAWLSLCSAMAYAADHTAPGPADARASLQSALAAIDTWHGRFEQRVTDESGGIVEEGEGVVWLRAPDQFRWQYETPWPRLLLSDGSDVWLFDEELDQVTVRSIDAAARNTPAALLTGDAAALERYRVAHVEGGGTRFRLEPLDGSGDFSRIELEFRDGGPALLRLGDRFGQDTTIRFEPQQSDQSFTRELFTLTVPGGVDVIDERAR